MTSTNTLGKVSTFTYDSESKLLTLSNPLDKTWSVVYNPTNTVMTDPLSGTVTHTYQDGLVIP